MKHLRWGSVIIDNKDVHIEESIRLYTEDLVGFSETANKLSFSSPQPASIAEGVHAQPILRGSQPYRADY